MKENNKNYSWREKAWEEFLSQYWDKRESGG